MQIIINKKHTFNSLPDSHKILKSIPKKYTFKIYFQFPTGFSQLISVLYIVLWKNYFQFPTGFSLRFTQGTIKAWEIIFQFPTGFSQPKEFIDKVTYLYFQFPTGFSLIGARYYSEEEFIFQFPTGFSLGNIIINGIHFKYFQFPTGFSPPPAHYEFTWTYQLTFNSLPDSHGNIC